MDRLRSLLSRWFKRRLVMYAQAELINERIIEFERKIEQMEESHTSRFTIEREREEFRRHIRQMEEARDGFRDWPDSERVAAEAIAAQYLAA
jgi:hypothetical protein